jgi:hypothetical protein
MEAKISVRKGMPSVQLSKEEFRQRYLDRFFDPLFEANKPELDAIVENAWTAGRFQSWCTAMQWEWKRCAAC